MKARIYFLDNLRTFLIFLVVVLHSGLVYESVLENVWIVVDPVKNHSIGLIRMYLDVFVMFCIFFISGYFIRFSLKSKSPMEFVVSKFKRIMVPWLIAVFTLIPAYKAIFLFSRGLPQQEWYSYLYFFERDGSDLGFYANNPDQNWLWFLPILFTFQLAYLALSKINLLSINISVKKAVILSFVLGLVYSMFISEFNLKGWAESGIFHFQRERLIVYFLAFLLGSLCNKNKVFDSANKNKKEYVIANVLLTISMGIFTAVALNFFFNIIDPSRSFYFISEFIDRIFYYASALLTMFAFLYILLYSFRFNLNKTNTLMKQLNKSSYAVYILHTIVIGILAMILLHVDLPALVKFIILTISTFILTNMIIYTYQKTLQKNINMKTIAISIFVILITGVSINLNKGNAANNQNPAAASEINNIKSSKIDIHKAVLMNNIDLVKEYIENGADLNLKDAVGGSSPLITACVFGKTEIAILFIEAGADLNCQNNEGSTPLHSAAFFCHPEIVDSLLANGANKNLKNNSGSLPIDAVNIPFEAVKGVYDYFASSLGPLGLKLDYERIKSERPKIALMLQ